MAADKQMGKKRNKGKNPDHPGQAPAVAAKIPAAQSSPQSVVKPADPKAQAAKAAQAMDASMKTIRLAQMFSQATGVLMRDPVFGGLPVRELEFVLLPPLLAGQCVVGNAPAAKDGGMVPVALALWARVSPAVDKRISESFETSVRLRPNEWTSGNIVWLMTMAGSPRALTELVKQICEKDLKGQEVKLVVTDKAGKRSIQVLNRDKSKAN